MTEFRRYENEYLDFIKGKEFLYHHVLDTVFETRES